MKNPPKIGSGELDAAGLVERIQEVAQATMDSNRLDGDILIPLLAIRDDAARAKLLLPSTSNDARPDMLQRGVRLAEAFLRYFNPNDLPEDSSMQWQQLEHWAKTALAAPVDHPEVVGERISINTLADVINRARYVPGGLPERGVDDEDKGSREYAFRLARAVYAALQPSDSPALEAGVVEVYEAAKAVARYRGEIAQMTARGYARQDYRFYMERVDALLDEAIQVVEDRRRERAALATPAKEDGK